MKPYNLISVSPEIKLIKEYIIGIENEIIGGENVIANSLTGAPVRKHVSIVSNIA